MAAENCAMRKRCHPAPNGLTIWTCFIFRTKCDFLQVLDLLIFRQVARLLTPVPLPFSPFFYIHILFAKWQWILRIEILEEIKCGNNSETAVSELVVSVCHPPLRGTEGVFYIQNNRQMVAKVQPFVESIDLKILDVLRSSQAVVEMIGPIKMTIEEERRSRFPSLLLLLLEVIGIHKTTRRKPFETCTPGLPFSMQFIKHHIAVEVPHHNQTGCLQHHFNVLQIVTEHLTIGFESPHTHQRNGIIDPHRQKHLLVLPRPIKFLQPNVRRSTEHRQSLIRQLPHPKTIPHQLPIANILALCRIFAFSDDIDISLKCKHLLIFLSEFVVAVPTYDSHDLLNMFVDNEHGLPMHIQFPAVLPDRFSV